ncbi:MAG: ABC transporter ATP-binding protein [Erysipelotrichaceae bacterium]|nr:ABC transporter ATP-binding protein [Erysipelotrichaceae bacterium]MDY5251821.1 ABC transporter ATP-binding protein [Erysipelotrichaceae bacterium]
MIILEHVNKSYQLKDERIPVLKDISLHIARGEYVSILGASGSGKTTLMNIIGCMDHLDSGEYYLDGKKIDYANPNQLAKLRNEKVGFIFQKYHLINKYTIVQNVMLPLLISGKRYLEAYENAQKMLNDVGLGHRLNHKPNELSGGQQQRASIARALVCQPAILLADEPTGALDSKTGQDILMLFKQLNENGHTIIQITHDEKVAKMAKRILYLKDGMMSEEA